jgi:hypothetical protein
MPEWRVTQVSRSSHILTVNYKRGVARIYLSSFGLCSTRRGERKEHGKKSRARVDKRKGRPTK